ncbi:hypothetical protein SDC9_184855 [bioreactor metagenome]|uniref:Secretion system C-terminal sorting domain-containing protein n=1 Tax=bioreactor metagenome TaxID=1076179 RepID=A0A645HE74_9ZZZZ
MLKFTDTKYYYGLSFWAVSGQGNGSIGIYNTKGDLLKKFNPDFGKQFTYSFVLDEFTWIVDEPKFNLSIYPNPSNEFLMIQTYENIDNATVSIFDAAGQIVYEAIKSIKEDESLPIDISKLSAGAYSVRIARDNKLIWNKFIKN